MGSTGHRCVRIRDGLGSRWSAGKSNARRGSSGTMQERRAGVGRQDLDARSVGTPALRAQALRVHVAPVRAQHEPRNPVGRGFYASAREAMNCPLPNLEDPLRCMEGPTDRVEPVGLGPIARGWQSRLALAGTYDAQWVERRAPLWPRDFDERFFFAAAPGLRTTPHLRGGEQVVLSGCSPDGQYAFLLPQCRLGVKIYFRHRKELRALRLDAVHLEPDEHAVTLIWRATIPAHRQLSAFEHGVVRELEPWEE
jgi:hypothetical protein